MKGSILDEMMELQGQMMEFRHQMKVFRFKKTANEGIDQSCRFHPHSLKRVGGSGWCAFYFQEFLLFNFRENHGGGRIATLLKNTIRTLND
ncbi:hypothetical protein [Parahaliea aestuarii]|uniref:Uncharacterized protein n=1 Tax=Parahaliea aestuarii TaxID=1852021 RepID=A0A5C8ZQ04_9GAMM|nr:hypothetical protein [Parahaliea aestuarii]TXS89577.1 hypothetical protein FVW59_16285 [Parahaliea aestuarii]